MSARPRRVAVVTPHYPPDVGGVENYVEHAVRVLRASDDHVPVVVTTSSSRRSYASVRDGVRVIRLGTWWRLSNTPMNPLWPWSLARLFRRLEIDLISAHSPLPLFADAAVLAAGRRPVVLTYHSGTLVKGSSVLDPLLRAYERWLLPSVFRHCRTVVSVSPAAVSYSAGGDLLPPGVDDAEFTPGDDRQRTRSLLYVGRLERSSRWKGVDVLIDALRLLPDVVLDVVGDGDWTPELRRRAVALGVGDRVRWHGSLSHRATVEHYRRCGAVVLPSLTDAESFGMVLVEAMACATPVIASRLSGPSFVVRDGIDGLLVPPGDAGVLAVACRRILDDASLARALGSAGRAAVEERWSWRHRDQELLAVHRDAVAGRD